MEINFGNRMETLLSAFCKANGIVVEEYVISAVEAKFNLDRYGDMNNMLKQEEPVKPKTRRKKAEKADKSAEVETKGKEMAVQQPVGVVTEPLVAELHEEPAVESAPKRRRKLVVK